MKRNNIVFLLFLLIMAIAAGSYFSGTGLSPLQLTWRIIVVVFLINIFLIAVVILMEKRNPYKTIAWLLIFIVFPIGGYILYSFFGRDLRREKVYKNLQNCHRCERILEANRKRVLGAVPDCPQLSTLIENTTALPMQYRNTAKVLTNGPYTFREIIKALKKARHHIHMEYYIIRDDKLGRKIRDILIDKANEGVEVRILYDGVGCLQLPKKFFDPLKKAGGEIAVFLPLKFPFLDYRTNYRNHRKILIVDGAVGFLGGLNIGDEYLGKSRAFNFWRDTHIKLEGDSVYSMQAIFLQDWTSAVGKSISCADYFPPHNINTPKPIHIVASSPDSKWESMQKLYVRMVSMARTKLYITTPYLIPDESLLTALKISALSGLDVRLLVPGIPDKKIVHWASRSYYQELMEAGIRVYEYNRGFIHAKVIQVDNRVASVGTANLDIRSLHLGYEVNAIVYDEEVVKTLEGDFFRDLKHAVEIDPAKWKDRPMRKHLVEATARLFSPLL
ncbi:MAG: cardiolipin synthase [Clostridia bacterium]|jgi:cardiolipin synthase